MGWINKICNIQFTKICRHQRLICSCQIVIWEPFLKDNYHCCHLIAENIIATQTGISRYSDLQFIMDKRDNGWGQAINLAQSYLKCQKYQLY